MYSVAIVLPIYKIKPTIEEIFAIENNFKKLNNYPKFIIAPEGFIHKEYGDILDKCKIIYLAPHWFKSLSSYNRLMLTKMFYKLFISYDYILILQSDTLVFRNELSEWCSKGYSYIGAPWPNGKFIQPYSFFGSEKIYKLLPILNRPKKCFVGNGGLSLRNVKNSIMILKKHLLAAIFWSSQEDYFWAYYCNDNGINRTTPSEIEASRFSTELEADHYYLKNGLNLPFGCHAYERYTVEFWKKIIQKM